MRSGQGGQRIGERAEVVWLGQHGVGANFVGGRMRRPGARGCHHHVAPRGEVRDGGAVLRVGLQVGTKRVYDKGVPRLTGCQP